MKNQSRFGLLTLFLILLLYSLPNISRAQSILNCDSIVEGEFTSNNEIQEYQISLNIGDKLAFYVEILERYVDLRVIVGIIAPNGFVIYALEDPYYRDTYKFAETSWVTEEGNYTIQIKGFTSTGGKYALHVGCVHPQAYVVSSHKLVNSAPCGSIIENKFVRNDERHLYYTNLNLDDVLRVTIEATGNYSDVTVIAAIQAPSGFIIAQYEDPYYRGKSKTLETEKLAETGTYVIGVRGFTGTGGPYRVLVGCTRGDGTVINEGDMMPDPTPIPPTVMPTLAPGNPAFLGFPGIASKDFSAAFLIPLNSGVATQGTIPASGDAVLGFTLVASANDTLDLTFSRVSGNLNLGLVVLSADNKVVFQASLVTSQTLNTRFTLPSAGTYTIGVFRTDLLPPDSPEATAFQIQGTLNP